MSVQNAAGYPQIADSGLIPTLYADEFNVEYWATTLLPRITTGRFYEKLLNQGDKIIIPTAPTITTKTYVKGQKLDIETPVNAPIEMTVDRARYFNLLVDKIDAKQSHMKIGPKYMEVGIKQMKEDVETEFLNDVYTQAAAANQGATAGVKSGAYNLGVAGSPLSVTTTTVTDIITRARAVLGEQNAADHGKIWLIIPEWMRYLLVNSDLKKAMEMGDQTSVYRTGKLGSIDGMDIYTSNLLPTSTADQTTGSYCIAGNMDAISYINQLNDTDTIKSETTFGQLFRGLFVYDWKVRKPEGLVTMYTYKGAET